MELRTSPLSSRTITALRRRARITTLQQLNEVMVRNPLGIEYLRGIGPAGYKDIQDYLAEMSEELKLARPPKSKAPEVPKICSDCHQELERLPWNTKGDLLVCQNTECRRYSDRQGFIPVSMPNMYAVLGKQYRPFSFEG